MRISLIIMIITMNFTIHGQDSTKYQGIYSEIDLELNNGSKWLISKSMNESIEGVFTYFDKASRKSNINSKKLAKKLMGKAEKIYDVCDLEGESHNMFHHWLVPFWKLLEEFRDSQFKEDQPEYFFKINNAKAVLNLYFE